MNRHAIHAFRNKNHLPIFISKVNKCVLLAVILSFTGVATSSATEFSGGSNGLSMSDLPYNTTSVRVSGPGDFYVESDDGYLQAADGQTILDGQYNYEVYATVDTPVAAQAAANSGRGEYARASNTPVKLVESGHFRIMNGEVLKDAAEEER